MNKGVWIAIVALVIVAGALVIGQTQQQKAPGTSMEEMADAVQVESSGAFEQMTQQAQQTVSRGAEQVAGTVENITTEASSRIQAAQQTVATGAEQAVAAVEEAASQSAEAVTSAAQTAQEQAQQLGETATNQLKAALGSQEAAAAQQAAAAQEAAEAVKTE